MKGRGGEGEKGRVVALTQSRGRLEMVQALLEQRGYEVIRQPLIETQPLLDEQTKLEAQKLLDCAWILFTSRTAAETWRKLLPPPSFLLPPLFGAVGKKTAEALQDVGATVEIIADQQNAENFAEMFLSHPKAASPVGLPQGDKALGAVQRKLEQAGFEVRPLVIYRTMLQPYQFQNSDVPKIDVIVFSSPSAVEAAERIGDAKLVAIGVTTLEAIEARGWQALQSSSPNAEAIVEAVEQVTLEVSQA